mmetsp:Transcript_5141/g.10200  ORF Transcript_5141/g.10200 Transcript_5141/m.10200 type:complete len:133 (-) Transcript_5141:149-547(-)
MDTKGNTTERPLLPPQVSSLRPGHSVSLDSKLHEKVPRPSTDSLPPIYHSWKDEQPFPLENLESSIQGSLGFGAQGPGFGFPGLEGTTEDLLSLPSLLPAEPGFATGENKLDSPPLSLSPRRCSMRTMKSLP